MATIDLMSTAELSEHHQRIRRCRGSACFVEFGAAMGSPSINQLELTLYPERRSVSQGEPTARTGICRQWRRGKAPSDESIARAYERSGGKADLRYWRDLPLWDLLQEPFELDTRQINEILTRLPADVREIVFVSSKSDANGKFSRVELTDQSIALLRSLATLDAFIALLALARFAYLVGNDQQHAVLTASAFAIFAVVLKHYRQLEINFDDLFLCLKVSFWSCRYLAGIQNFRERELIERHLEQLQLDSDAHCEVRIGYLQVETPNSGISKLANYFYSVLGGKEFV